MQLLLRFASIVLLMTFLSCSHIPGNKKCDSKKVCPHAKGQVREGKACDSKKKECHVKKKECHVKKKSACGSSRKEASKNGACQLKKKDCGKKPCHLKKKACADCAKGTCTKESCKLKKNKS